MQQIRSISKYKCKTCGGDLVLTIGSDRAVCDHCGLAAEVAEKDVKKYLNAFNSAEALMRTDTLAGYTNALPRLQAISFIPQAREKAEFCERRAQELRKEQAERRQRTEAETGKKDSAIGIIILVLLAVFFLAAVGCAVYVIYRLVKGDLSQTEVIVLIAVAAVFAALLVLGKLKG